MAGDSVGGPGAMNFWRVTYPTFYNDKANLKASLKRIAGLATKRIHNSHGKAVSREQIERRLLK